MRNSSTSEYTQICLSHMQLYSDLAILLAFPHTATNMNYVLLSCISKCSSSTTRHLIIMSREKSEKVLDLMERTLSMTS
jgi:hypothetical protein